MWLLGINQKWTRTNWNSMGPRTRFLESNVEHNARFLLVLFTNLDLLMVFLNNNAFGKHKNQVLTYCMRTQPRSQLSDPHVTFSFPFFPSRPPPTPPFYLNSGFLLSDCCCYRPLWRMRSLLHIKQRSVCVAVSAWKIESCQINEKGQRDALQRSGMTSCEQPVPSVRTNTHDCICY